jgi:hypothetical protein
MRTVFWHHQSRNPKEGNCGESPHGTRGGRGEVVYNCGNRWGGVVYNKGEEMSGMGRRGGAPHVECNTRMERCVRTTVMESKNWKMGFIGVGRKSQVRKAMRKKDAHGLCWTRGGNATSEQLTWRLHLVAVFFFDCVKISYNPATLHHQLFSRVPRRKT